MCQKERSSSKFLNPLITAGCEDRKEEVFLNIVTLVAQLVKRNTFFKIVIFINHKSHDC